MRNAITQPMYQKQLHKVYDLCEHTKNLKEDTCFHMFLLTYKPPGNVQQSYFCFISPVGYLFS
jgi:hypothetical protein